MGRELRIQLGENKGDKYKTWREQGRHVRKQMADEKNQGSQQAPRKKNSKRERERERERERKKERKQKDRKKERQTERKKERKKGTKWRQQGRQVRKQTMDKEHPMSILCAGSTQREQQQRRKKCQNKLRTSRETGAETDGTQGESCPQSNQNKEH